MGPTIETNRIKTFLIYLEKKQKNNAFTYNQRK